MQPAKNASRCAITQGEPPHIESIAPNGLAAGPDYGSLRPGLVLTSIQGVEVAPLGFRQALAMLREAGRPLVLEFAAAAGAGSPGVEEDVASPALVASPARVASPALVAGRVASAMSREIERKRLARGAAGAPSGGVALELAPEPEAPEEEAAELDLPGVVAEAAAGLGAVRAKLAGLGLMQLRARALAGGVRSTALLTAHLGN